MSDLPYNIEAVQFGEWRPWHAVDDPLEHDRTRCGLDALNAKGMWRDWEEPGLYRCLKCQRREAS